MERTGLPPVRHQLIGTLSKGYRQRVGIAQALLGEPKVIILDEPTVGLDPLQIIEIRQLIRDLGERHTVILSSHILSEVQALCQQVLILSRGKLVAFDTPEALEKRMRAEQSALFRVRTDRETAEAVLASVPGLAGWDLPGGGGRRPDRGAPLPGGGGERGGLRGADPGFRRQGSAGAGAPAAEG